MEGLSARTMQHCHKLPALLVHTIRSQVQAQVAYGREEEMEEHSQWGIQTGA
jgi:hypothetical protein